MWVQEAGRAGAHLLGRSRIASSRGRRDLQVVHTARNGAALSFILLLLLAYMDMPVPDHLMNCFTERRDGQIMGLEILSIALGTDLFI